MGEYKLVYHGRAGVSADRLKGTLGGVKSAAIEAVEAGRATRVEIFDDVGRKLYHYPAARVQGSP